MGVFGGPEIPNDGLVLALDAGNPRNFNLTAVEVLVVGGGGGGASRHPGGGGGGGVIYNSNFAVTPGTQLTVTVGTGGNGKTLTSNLSGDNGSNSVFGSLTALGGGGGGTYLLNGASGGSSGGGGEGGITTSESATQPSSVSGGFGNAGGGQSVSSPSYGGGGGGGGAGGPGTSGNGTTAGSGGPGLQFSISGTPTYYAGGGGGAAYNLADGTGGLGGGGNGATESSTPPNGTVNTGGGGGGNATGTSLALTSGAGGSGIVIVRYPGPQKAIGGTVTSVGGDTIHTFTTSGNFTPLVNTNGSAVLGLSDLSGNRNFGTTAGSPTYNSANGGSLYFEGSNEYISGSNFSSLQLLNDFTISAWVKLGSGGSASQGIFEKMSTTNGYNGYGITRQDGYFKFWTASNNSYAYTNSNITYSSGDNWYYVVGRRMSGINQLFVNSIIQSDSQSPPLSDSGEIYVIGRYYSDIDSYYFVGNIAQVSIYNRALSAAEVSQNFNALRGRYGL